MTVTNYAQTFESVLQEKYAVESKSEGLSTNPAPTFWLGRPRLGHCQVTLRCA